MVKNKPFDVVRIHRISTWKYVVRNGNDVTLGTFSKTSQEKKTTVGKKKRKGEGEGERKRERISHRKSYYYLPVINNDK